MSVSPSRKQSFILILCVSCLSFVSIGLAQKATAATPDAQKLVKSAMDYWRSKTSYTEVVMSIHRPDWNRTMSMRGWTRGTTDSTIIFTSPRKDAGNATLKLVKTMWMFTPKLNQVIKLPASMMSQSWMGSDFSYNDLAKSDQIINEYTHKIVDTQQQDGHTVYTIESIPNADAPVVWGKEILRIRDDYILISEQFYDQDMKLVKQMETTKIGPLGGRNFPLAMRMTSLEEKDHWTELTNQVGHFDIKLPDYLFSLSNLRNPRSWKAP